jgi:hypothetical protein
MSSSSHFPKFKTIKYHCWLETPDGEVYDPADLMDYVSEAISIQQSLGNVGRNPVWVREADDENTCLRRKKHVVEMETSLACRYREAVGLPIILDPSMIVDMVDKFRSHTEASGANPYDNQCHRWCLYKILTEPTKGWKFVTGKAGWSSDNKPTFWEYEGIAPKKRVKIGRNQLCPCGSGKKYKKCCIVV